MKIATLFITLFIFGTNNSLMNKLADTNWSLVKISDGTTTKIADDSCNASLHFDSKGQYNGFSGWNHYNGKYSVASKGKLTMDNPMRTKKAGMIKCKLGEMLFDVFPKVESYTIKSDSLYLCTADCVQVVFVRK